MNETRTARCQECAELFTYPAPKSPKTKDRRFCDPCWAKLHPGLAAMWESPARGGVGTAVTP